MTRKNVHPSVWGRPAWEFLRNCAEACDSPSAPQYEAFIQLLPYVLPCAKCRAHAKAYIEANPVDTSDLRGWLSRFEAHVSQQKKAPNSTSPRCEMPSSNAVAKPDMILAILLFLLLLTSAIFKLVSLVK